MYLGIVFNITAVKLLDLYKINAPGFSGVLLTCSRGLFNNLTKRIPFHHYGVF